MSLQALVDGLAEANVDFVIVGMVAGRIHGSRYNTEDLDIVYETSPENIDRLYGFVSHIDAYVKETWPNEGVARALERDDFTFEGSLTLGTSEGELDVLHRIDGIGGFADVLAVSQVIQLRDGVDVHVLSLPALIEAKRAAGRETDRLHLTELEAILEMRG